MRRVQYTCILHIKIKNKKYNFKRIYNLCMRSRIIFIFFILLSHTNCCLFVYKIINQVQGTTKLCYTTKLIQCDVMKSKLKLQQKEDRNKVKTKDSQVQHFCTFFKRVPTGRLNETMNKQVFYYLLNCHPLIR